MQTTELRSIDVLTLLPQRPPFVMIDRLIHYDQVLTTTEFLVRGDNLFVEGNVLNPCALVENIAQTCAARLGYINKYILHEGLRLGYIGAIRNLRVLRPVVLGEKLTTSIEVVDEFMKLTLVNATIKVGDEQIVTAEMKIALSEKDAL